MTQSRLAVVAALVFCFGVAPASQGSAETITVTQQEPSKLIVQSRDIGNGVASGVVKNLSNDTINEVTLLIQHSWSWKNEFHPGPVEDNPGRAEFQTISQSIAPGGTLEFQYTPRIPLPNRTDGHFATTISVHEYTTTGHIDQPIVP